MNSSKMVLAATFVGMILWNVAIYIVFMHYGFATLWFATLKSYYTHLPFCSLVMISLC